MLENTNAHQTLPTDAKKVWRINNGLWSIVLWLMSGYLGFLKFYGADVALWIVIVLLLMTLFSTVLFVAITPQIRWRQWSYRIDEHEIELQHGIFIIQRTLIPVKRVQHVDTRQGPILRGYDLADVVISTAATTHKIPALAEHTADQARSEISTFARKAKEDV